MLNFLFWPGGLIIEQELRSKRGDGRLFQDGLIFARVRYSDDYHLRYSLPFLYVTISIVIEHLEPGGSTVYA